MKHYIESGDTIAACGMDPFYADERTSSPAHVECPACIWQMGRESVDKVHHFDNPFLDGARG